MDPAEVEGLLYSAALSQAVALGYRFGDGADSDMRSRARDAATMIFQAPRSDAEREFDIEHAVRTFRLVVDTMIGMRREAYRHSPADLQGNLIGEETLRLAMVRLCPGLWPFC